MKVSAKLDRRFADKQGRFPLKVAISQKGGTAYIPLGISLTSQQWDGARVVAHPQKGALNLTIEQRVFAFRQAATDYCLACRERGYTPTATEIRDAVAGDNEVPAAMLFATYERYLASRTPGNTLTSYTQTYRKVCAFVGPDDLPLDDIDVGWLEDFDDHLRKDGLSVNGRAVHHRNLRALLNYAIDHNLTSSYPYRRFRIPTQPTPHRDLSPEDFRRVATVQLPEHLARWRDLFLLSFCLAGINIKDLSLLTDANIRGGRLRYLRSKTHHPFDIALTPQARGLIDRLRYKGEPTVPPCSTRSASDLERNTTAEQRHHPAEATPLLDFATHNYRSQNKRMNHALNTIADNLDIPHFTSYAARHSFASFAAAIGIQPATIAELLGHARTVTDIYIRFDHRLADEALARVTDFALPR